MSKIEFNYKGRRIAKKVWDNVAGIKSVGTWGVGGLIGVGAWWRVEAFPVSGKACISVNLNKIK